MNADGIFQIELQKHCANLIWFYLCQKLVAFLQASLSSWLLHLSSQTHRLLMCENSKFFHCIFWIIYIKSTFSSIFCSLWLFPHYIHSTNKTSKSITRDFPVVQCLRLYAASARGEGSIPGQGRFHMPCGQKKKKSICTWTENFRMFKLDLEKVEEPKIKGPTSVGW